MDLSKLYQTQISLTEWFQKIGLENVEAHRKEDNEKRERLAALNEYFGLPFDRPTQFPASDVANRTEQFVKFVNERGDELCALRLIPIDPSMPKLRTRGASIRESLEWFAEQNVQPELYKADFVPHPTDHVWSTIFVINQHGAFGQIVAGSHNQLTQGFYDAGTEPMTFLWNGESIGTNPKNVDAEKHLLDVFKLLRVSDSAVRNQLVEKFGAKFFGEYLCGYFETVSSKQFGTWFIDWNRILGAAYADTRTLPLSEGKSERVGTEELYGQIGSPGIATGQAFVLRATDFSSDVRPCLPAGRLPTPDEPFILVTDMTTPDFLPLMMKAGGVVTALGGILSHAAIVCRELGKPCLTNVKGLLEAINDGDVVEVDAERGMLKKVKQNAGD